MKNVMGQHALPLCGNDQRSTNERTDACNRMSQDMRMCDAIDTRYRYAAWQSTQDCLIFETPAAAVAWSPLLAPAASS